MKTLIKSIFAYCDLHVQRMSTMALPFVDMRHQSPTLQQLAADAELKPILADLRLDACRYGSRPIQQHPYYIALSLHGDSVKSMTKWLFDYLHTMKDVSVTAYMGLQLGAWPLLDKESFRCKYYPWNPLSLDEYRTWMLEITRAENEKLGIKPVIQTSSNLDTWIKLQSEQHAWRLWRLKESISKSGYTRHNGHDGDSGGQILLGENDSACWVSEKGHHRKIVAAFMGYECVPVRISRIIRKSEAKCWRSVRDGLVSIEVAHQIFDNVIKGFVPLQQKEAVAKINAQHLHQEARPAS
jgi:hypothetical protein